MALKLRLRLVESPPYAGRLNDPRLKKGRCRGCGKLLTTEQSKKRGYGPECFEKYIALVFELVPVAESIGAK
jgi:hypothetical protein